MIVDGLWCRGKRVSRQGWYGAVGAEICTLSCVMESAETVSSVTRTASCFEVPASRRECARTRAPGWSKVSGVPDTVERSGQELTWEVGVAQEKLCWGN